MTSAEEKQKQRQEVETETNSLKRFNENESVSSDLTPEEQSEKPSKLVENIVASAKLKASECRRAAILQE